jgi:hypothetical protein
MKVPDFMPLPMADRASRKSKFQLMSSGRISSVTRFCNPMPGFRRASDFVELPAGLDQSWHHAPARQIVVVLSGTIEVGTSDDQKRRSTAGQAFIADDLTGKGHVTRVVDGPARVMFVKLPDSFDCDRWTP